MTNRRDIMIDLETTGLNPFEHQITSFCFAAFDINSSADTTYRTGACPYNEEAGCNEETMQWRRVHGIPDMEDDLPIFTNKEMIDILGILVQGEINAVGKQNVFIWAKPVLFDLVFLQKQYDRSDTEVSWSHRNTRDVYTYVELYANSVYKSPYEFSTSIHNAHPHHPEWDCSHQIKMVQKAYKHYEHRLTR